MFLDDGVSHRNMYELFNVNFNANLKLLLRLSNCASVGEKKMLIIIKMHGSMYVKISRQIFEKYSNTKFYRNPSSGSLFDPCGHADGQMDGQKHGHMDRYD
jgi:hypothetical protein